MSQQQPVFAAQIINYDLNLNAPVVARFALAFAVTVTKWHMRNSTRKALAQLPDSLLCDIGLTRDAAYTEARRPFWRA
ncbi:hypothetical protein TG4357_00147 [Thalassovita gelatinovora]|uniref:YjiS-like domain-containing protein n=1 Tax=Thalassovita gelatinovora TaxID=53501 RepID=A0A0N7LU49_THAGE|nr:DUF1127 domain-containing protein [Thalassovita gelatinovora]QIZ79286.1 DUF1127 domain-containing protein [Thalassovita gelatinovora]CUH62506.1 hypothetical protein TG4357_00147 [Thalassovita gelatinovora]SEQ05647.1 Uncharacterized conserved protein YjiS, DUF1127 family [Thalassovita gelatinovora]